jgi:antirestriction protein ArdC
MKADIYQRITDRIIRELEKGVRPWMKPWHAEHVAGRITRPLRGNGIPYRGINVLVLWSEAVEKGYAAPIWMTFKQATELKANVRKGEHGAQRARLQSDTRYKYRRYKGFAGGNQSVRGDQLLADLQPELAQHSPR